MSNNPASRHGRPTGAAELERPARWVAVSAVLVAALIWSASFAVTKVALTEVPPMTIGALRFAIAAVVLGLIVRGRGEPVLLTRRQKGRIGGVGLLGITAYFALENIGVNMASASDATLIVASYPVITLVCELVGGRSTFSGVRLAGMALAVGGVFIVVGSAPSAASGVGHHLLGDVILLVGGVAWALYNLMAQRESSDRSAVVVTYYQTLAGACGFVVLSLTEVDQWSAPSGGTWLRISFLALFCSVAAFLAYNFGLRGLPASVAVNLLNIVPVAGLVWAVLLAGERLVPAQLAGGAVVVVGVSMGLRRTRRDRVTTSSSVRHTNSLDRNPSHA